MAAVKTLNEALISMRDFGVRHRTRNAISFGTFEECKCILRRTMLRIDETIEDFEWLEQYDEVAQWMSNTEGRGLFLRGGCGVGKTNILLSLAIIFNQYKNLILPVIQARDLVKMPNICTRWAYSIDDVGTEGLLNNYGEKRDMLAEVVHDAEYKHKLLILSTNLRADEFSKRYDDRTLDRICGLCKIIKFQRWTKSENEEKRLKDIPSLRKRSTNDK